MVVEELLDFVRRQGHNFKLVLIKRVGFSLFNNLTVNYVNVYIRLLGASFVQLGFVGSIGALMNSIISYPFGWLIDRYSAAKILIVTIFTQALVPLTYFYARDWVWIAMATALSTLAFFCASGVENVIIANSLRDDDRATGFASVTALSMIPNIVIPLVAGAILTQLGGLSVDSINVLFLIEFAGLVLISVYVSIKLRGTQSLGQGFGPSLIGAFRSVLSGSPVLKRWLIIDTLSASSFTVMARYIMVYAAEEQGAGPMIIGAMGVATALVSIVSSIPLGHLADRIGRIRTILLLRPFFHASTLILLYTPDPRLIVIGWALRGTFQPSLSILAAYRNELVDPSERGRWMGIRELLRGIFRIPAPILGGLLYTYISPQAPFLFHIIADVFIRIPLLITMPKTLKTTEVANSDS
ncbi:MAG: MFS transporter [Candidatus Thorarchaeota archaeon]